MPSDSLRRNEEKEYVTQQDGEESDEYELEDEGSVSAEDGDEDESDEESDEEEEKGGGLTHLLLGDAATDDHDPDDDGYVPDGGKEPADYSGDEDDGDIVEIPRTKPPSSVSQKPPSKLGKGLNGFKTTEKRSRDDEDEGTRQGKKVKA